MAKAKRFLSAVLLLAASAAGGCLGAGDDDGPARRSRGESDTEVKQGALDLPFGCAHSPCREGGVLVPGCGPNACVAWICGVDPYCCTNYWDSWCVQEVGTVCQLRCDCGTICAQGNAYYPDACLCTSQVYSADPYCGETAWDSQCVAEANSLCGAGCP